MVSHDMCPTDKCLYTDNDDEETTNQSILCDHCRTVSRKNRTVPKKHYFTIVVPPIMWWNI